MGSFSCTASTPVILELYVLIQMRTIQLLIFTEKFSPLYQLSYPGLDNNCTGLRNQIRSESSSTERLDRTGKDIMKVLISFFALDNASHCIREAGD